MDPIDAIRGRSRASEPGSLTARVSAMSDMDIEKLVVKESGLVGLGQMHG